MEVGEEVVEVDFQAVVEEVSVGVGLQGTGEKTMNFSKEDEAKIVAAICEAESKTSGEIRVHVAKQIKKSVYAEACATFEKLGMTKTQERNGILIFLVSDRKEFSIIGDLGIHQKVGGEFWDHIRNAIQDDFKKGEFAKGLVEGVLACGEALSKYFPYQSNDQNELSDVTSHS